MKKCQLYLLQSLSKKGVPRELMIHFLGRCGATETDWLELLTSGLAELVDNRYQLSRAGRKIFKEARKSRSF